MTNDAAPPEFDITAALNRALFAHAAVESQKAVLSQEEQRLAEAVAALEKLMAEKSMTNVGSTMGNADITWSTVYNVPDWAVVHAHVRETGAFDLLYRRLNTKAVRDRDSNNEMPPGINRVTLPKLKLTVR